MRTLEDPTQGRLFDPFDGVISDAGRRWIVDGWQATFRMFILQELPAAQLGDHLHPDLGRPSVELYSMCGLLLLRHFYDWTIPQTLEAALFRTDVQYALNLEPGFSISQRSLERYIKEMENDQGLSQRIHDVVADRLVQLLEQRVQQQRLDSTHIVSNMADFGRTRLMAITSKRFLHQLHRLQPAEYEALPEELRSRYFASDQRLFGSKTPEDRQRTRQQAAEDLYLLQERFAEHQVVSKWKVYQTLRTVFSQQCEVQEKRPVVRKKTGGDVIQNPSDPDATYSGHKGKGYQVQLSETCDPENEQQLVLVTTPQKACEADANAVEGIMDDLKSRNHLPESLTADCSYGSNENVQLAAAVGVTLVSPVPGGAVYDPEQVGPELFVRDPKTHEVLSCPAGHTPLKSSYNAESDRLAVTMAKEVCQGCPLLERCPAILKKASASVYFTMEEVRSRERRRDEQTPEFKEAYRRRAGIESTNSGLKRLGLGRLRVRGGPAVYTALRLKVACWNILRASQTKKLRAKLLETLAKEGLLLGEEAVFLSKRALAAIFRPVRTITPRYWRSAISRSYTVQHAV